jgi:hypothetical protein
LDFGGPLSGVGLCILGFDGLEPEKIEIVFLVKPGALEHLDGTPRARSQRHGIDNQLVYRVDGASLGFVVEKVDETISGLDDVNVPRDGFGRLRQRHEKFFGLVIPKFLRGYLTPFSPAREEKYLPQSRQK